MSRRHAPPLDADPFLLPGEARSLRFKSLGHAQIFDRYVEVLRVHPRWPGKTTREEIVLAALAAALPRGSK